MYTSPSQWAKDQTSINGIGIFLVAAIGGYPEKKAELGTQLTTAMDSLIADIDAITDRATHVELDQTIFFDYMKLSGYAKERNRPTYELGCVGITMCMTDSTLPALMKNAIYKSLEDVPDEPGQLVYAIHLFDNEAFKNNPDVQAAYNEQIGILLSYTNEQKAEVWRKVSLNNNADPADNEALSSSEESWLASYEYKLNYYNTSSADDYALNPDGSVDITGWDRERRYWATNFDFGFYIKPNAILHANRGVDKKRPDKPMLVYISNERNFSKPVSNSWDNGHYGCPCVGYPDFNRAVFGVIK